MALPLVVPAGITAARVAAPYLASLVRQYGPKVLGALTGASVGDKFIDIGQLEKDKDIGKLPASVKTETEEDFKIPPFMGVIPSVVDLIEGFSQADSKPKEKGFVQEDLPDMSMLTKTEDKTAQDFQNIIDAKGGKAKILEVGGEETEGTFRYKNKTFNKSDGVLKSDSGGKRWIPKESLIKTKSESSSVKTLQTREIEKILQENFSNKEMLNTSLPQLTKFLENQGIVFKSKTPQIAYMKVGKIRDDLTGQKVGRGGGGIERVPADQKKLRKPTSSLLAEFDEAGQTAISNFQNDLIKLTGFNKSLDDSMKVTSPLNRFLNGALNALKKGDTTTDEIIEQLNNVDKGALADVLKKNANIRNKLKRANELGIDLDDLNLSHMENIADNWKTSLDANNIFLATKEANQIIQRKLDKDIKKLFTNFRKAETLSEKKELVKEFKNIKKELIDNDLVSVIDGKKIGADVDFEKTFKKFSEKADAAILERLFKKDGGIISIEEMIKRPIYERY